MGNYRKCSIGHKFGWVSTHVCPPAYLVWCPEHDELEVDAKPIRANDAEEAVTEWADQYDVRTAEYPIVGGRDEPTVHARAPDGTVTRWQVTGESVPHYSARELEEGT